MAGVRAAGDISASRHRKPAASPGAFARHLPTLENWAHCREGFEIPWDSQAENPAIAAVCKAGRFLIVSFALSGQTAIHRRTCLDAQRRSESERASRPGLVVRPRGTLKKLE